MLQVSHVTKKYGSFTAVDDLSFSATPGKIYGLIGPNGAGKSTTIRMIMNILSPDSGSIELDGKPFSAEDSNRIGYLPEERGLYKKQKLNEVLLYLAALKGCSSRVAQVQIDYWLSRFDILEWKDKKVDTLSKGMAQKAQFTATILHNPDIVFLDEPFSGLDPVSADDLLAIVRELKDKGKLILFSTHVMEQAEKICDHIIMLNGGKKILDGDLGEIRKRHGKNTVTVRFSSYDALPGIDLSCAEFLSSLPMVAAVSEDGLAYSVTLATGFDSDSLLVALAGKARIDSFAVNEPSLHSVFVDIVQGKGE